MWPAAGYRISIPRKGRFDVERQRHRDPPEDVEPAPEGETLEHEADF